MRSKTPTPVDTVEEAHRLRVAVGRLGRRLRQIPSSTGLSPSQYEVLSTVVVRGPLRIAELVELEALNPTMVSRIVGHLESAGLVHRSQDQSDARVGHVETTEAGEQLVASVRAQRDDSMVGLLAMLGTSQRRKLSAALSALEALAEAARPSSSRLPESPDSPESPESPEPAQSAEPAQPAGSGKSAELGRDEGPKATAGARSRRSQPGPARAGASR